VGALAYGAPPVAPPPTLRGRILDAARAERASVTVLRPRWAVPVAAAAAIAACAAIGLGAWDVSLHNDPGGRGATLEHVALSGGSGSVLVTPGGSGALVVSDLAPAPAGDTYEAWVIRGRTAVPAGLFSADKPTTIVALSRPVPAGSRVAVTVEPAGGTSSPTRTPFLVSAPV
jgi:anti-sigma-K factor RskA